MQLAELGTNITICKMLTQVLSRTAADLRRVHNNELPDVVFNLENPMCLLF